MASYDQLLEQKGIIFNQGAKVAYQNQDQLAADLGITKDKIQWGNIAKAGADFNPTGYYGFSNPSSSSVISLDRLQPQQAVTLPTPVVSTTKADSAVAGATQTTKTLDQYIKEQTPTATAESTQSSALTQSLSSLLGETAGKTESLYAEEAKSGVPELSKQLSQLNSDILTGQAEYTTMKAQYDKLLTEAESKVKTMGSIRGEQQNILRNQAADLSLKGSEIALTQARAMGLQGQVEQAQKAAKMAVELKYAPIEDEIRIKQGQLSLLEPVLNKQEKILAAALDRQYADQKADIAEKKAKENQVMELMLNAASAGADSQTLNNISNSPDLLTAAQAFGTFQTQQFNAKQVQSAGITTPYAVTTAGEVWNSKTGYAYTSEQDFFTKTGMDIQTAAQRGMVSPLKAAGLEWSEPYLMGGDYVQKNNQTGQIRVAVNGSVGSGGGGGTNPATFKFSSDDRGRLIGAGVSNEDITQIQSFINQGNTIDDIGGINDSQKKVLQNVLGGVTPTQERAADKLQFLSKDYFKNLYTKNQLEQAAADAGFGDMGKGLFNLKDVNTEDYLNYLDKLVNQYRQAGYDDQEILKMMQ